MLSTLDMIEVAKKHLPALPEGKRRNNSAWVCVEDAVRQWLRGDAIGYESAQKWALRSLGHSVGVFHPDYQRVKDAIEHPFGK